MKKLLLLLAAAFSLFSAEAAERPYTFNFNGDEIRYYGTGRKETCDVAVCLNAPALSGYTITGISVAIPGNADSYGALSAFMTRQLNVELVDGLRVNVPDICSAEASIENGVLTATFAEPLKITDEPVYIGYSFTIKELTDDTEAPLAVVPGNNPEGLWFHSNRTSLKWSNYVDKEPGGIQSAMNILLSGDFKTNSAVPNLPARTVIPTGEEGLYSFTVLNYGEKEINSIECEWEAGSESGKSVYNFPTAVKNSLGASADASFRLPVKDTQGAYPVRVTVTKVNGEDNASPFASSESKLVYTDIMPVHLPLVEEYTGLWCGNCPRGYAALEWMKEKYGYEFVAASWHNSDPMAITNSYPSTVKGFPASWIDRNANMDPSAIPTLWPSYRDMGTDFAITCTTDFSSGSHSSLTAKTTILPIESHDTPLSIGYLLVADALSNPTWLQSNYYSGEVSSDIVGEWAEFFANAESKVKGLVYNDVVVNCDYALGMDNSLPSSLQAFNSYQHEVTFTLDDILNDSGNTITVDPEKVRVLAFIIDAKGNILNSCTSAYPGEPAPELSADEIEAESAIISSMWYDLMGNCISNPEGGIFIRVDILQDGSSRATKVVVP